MKENLYNKIEIGNRIDAIRMEKGLNKEEFAKELGMKGQQLGEIIRGKTGLSVEKLILLSNISGYSIDFILLGKKHQMNENLAVSISKIKDCLNKIDDEVINIEKIL